MEKELVHWFCIRYVLADCASQVFHVKNTSTWISCNIHFTRYFVNFFTWYPSVLNFTTFFHMHFTWNSFYVNFKRNSCKAKTPMNMDWIWMQIMHQQALSTLLYNYEKEKKKPHKLSHTFCLGKRTHFKMYPRAGYFCRSLFFVYPDQITNIRNMHFLWNSWEAMI